MRFQFPDIALLAAVVAGPLLCAGEVVDIPSDATIASLVASAKAARAQGHNADALAYFDAAVKRDSSDYMTLFQRGATYLSLGRNAQAKSDFDSVLNIRPDFEGALLQRGKIHARNAEWAAARLDYNKAGKKAEKEAAELEAAESASHLAVEAEKKKDWEACVSQAGIAIQTAGTALSLRQLRAKCRFERGEIQEGVSDLAHVLQIHPGNLDPHLEISSMLFYALVDTDRALTQIKKCLQSDSDHKSCKALHKQEKSLLKKIDKLNNFLERKQHASAARLLVGNPAEEDAGLLAEVKENEASAREQGWIHREAGSGLYDSLTEKTCECYVSMNSHKKAEAYCKEALQSNPNSVHGLLHKAQMLLDDENYDAAIATLNSAKEAHPQNHEVQEKLREAQTLLKRSKTKDYYKILGVSKDADEATIKKAYRKASKEFHPDKAMAKGVPKEEAEKKMAGINQAYEVLSDPELKQRFDRGEDPNDPMSQQGGNPFQGSPFGAGGPQFVFQQGGGQTFRFSGGNPFGGGFPFG